jgi:hypothetical protein
MLQKATMTPATAGDLSFCYDCPPHESGMATFRRMGVGVTCHTARFVKLLRVNSLVRRYLPLARPLELPLSLPNAFLRILDRAHRIPAGLTLENLPGDFDESFTALDEKLSIEDPGGIRARRRAEDLNWRYRSDPLRRYEVTVARRGREVQGYAVAWPRERTLRLVEMVWTTPEVRGALVRTLAENARGAGYDSMDTIASSTSLESSGLRDSGFRMREPTERLVVFGAARAEDRVPLDARWHLWASDVMA